MKRKKHKNKKIARHNNPNIFHFALLTGLVLAVAFVLTKSFGVLSKKSCANSISCIKNLSGEFEKGSKGIFEGTTVYAPQAVLRESTAVLGEAKTVNSGKKHIKVDLSQQRLFAYEGDKLVYTFSVSTGKWAPTPTGEFNIWVKLRATRMTGGNPARGTYYDLPNVPYVMYFSNAEVSASRGFSLHGTYWHNNFGYPMSHGCINMRTVDAEKIYNWATPVTTSNSTYATSADPGTTITVYGAPPDDSI